MNYEILDEPDMDWDWHANSIHQTIRFENYRENL